MSTSAIAQESFALPPVPQNRDQGGTGTLLSVSGISLPVEQHPSSHQIPATILNPALSANSPTPIRRMTANISEITPFDGPGYANTPSVLNLFYAPFDFSSSIRAWKESHRKKDWEGKIDATVRLSSFPLAFMHAFLGALIFFADLSESIYELEANFFKTIAFPTLFIGIALCGIETIYEICGIKRQHNLMKHQNLTLVEKMPALEVPVYESTACQPKIAALSSWLQRLDQDPSLLYGTLKKDVCQSRIDNLRQIESRLKATPALLDMQAAEEILQSFKVEILIKDIGLIDKKYFCLDAEDLAKITSYVQRTFPELSAAQKNEKIEQLSVELLNVKKMKLSRRTSPNLVQEIEGKIPNLLTNLQSPDPSIRRFAVNESTALFKEIRTACLKKLLIHFVGIAAVIFAVIGLIAFAFLTQTLWLTLFFITIGTTLTMGRLALVKWLLPTKGWNLTILQKTTNAALPAIQQATTV